MAWLFGFTMFAAAFLLFTVQPMIGKMVLPLLGGAPGVWNTCMVFYQTTLLAAYAYAHLAARRIAPLGQLALHVLLLGGSALALPMTLNGRWSPPEAGGPNPALGLFVFLLILAGLPFFLIATTAPLLQSWFARSGRAGARDPYFLYAASNAGSLAGLISYPWLIEPFLSLSRQSLLWSYGFALLAVLILACGAAVARSRAATETFDSIEEESTTATANPSRSSGVREWFGWAFLAFISSSWLLGVTTYLTTDLASIPLLWTIPLAIYLATYILAFARDARRWARIASVCLPVAAVPLVLVLTAGFVHLVWIPLHLLVFFLGALVCHGRLAASRPSARDATAFYLAIATGGALGGVFNAILAPVVFDRLAEYPLALVLGCLAIGLDGSDFLSRDRLKSFAREVIVPVVVTLIVAVLFLSPAGVVDTLPGMIAVVAACGLAVYAALTGSKRPLRFALTAAGVLLASTLAREPGGVVIRRDRDFFGTLRVLYDRDANAHRLLQGSTLHGQQSLDPARRAEPSTYFTRTGPIGQVFEAFRDRATAGSGRPARVGIVGLGAGTLASYAREGDAWTFYEIDPAVEAIAEDTHYFTYLADARARGATIDSRLGDARLRLRDADGSRGRLLVLDAFSSDAVPVHLLTREAIRLYLSRIEDDGMLVFNISNRYLDLEPLMALQAGDAGLVCRIRRDLNPTEAERKDGKQPSIWAVMARKEADLGSIASDSRWFMPRPRAGARVWTDDQSDLASYLILRGRRLPPSSKEGDARRPASE